MSLVYRGFIHPLLPGGPGGPRAGDVAVWARAQRLHVLARMARGPDTENMVREPGAFGVFFFFGWDVVQENCDDVMVL